MFFRTTYTLLAFAALCGSFDSRAQSFNTKYNFKHLNVQNGLAQNQVYHFLQDSRGYMWIGTHNGLTLYDGIKTINFIHKDLDSTSISGRFITAILEDSAGQVWVGNENGINRYNRSTNSFSHFPVERPGGKIDTTYCVPLGFNTATELWFLDTKTRSVQSLNTKTKKTSFVADLNTSHATFFKIASSGNVNIWSCYDKGTIHQTFKNGKLISQQSFFTDKNTAGQPVLVVGHVYQQNDSTAWVSTNEGVAWVDPVNGRYKMYNQWEKRPVREIRYAAVSPKGQLWLGSGPEGVFTFDIGTHQFIDNFRFDKSDPFSICSDNIVSLYFDKMGNAWCGSYGGGASYTNLESLYFNKHISKNDVRAWENDLKIEWAVFDRHDNLWCLFSATDGYIVLDKELKVKKRLFPLLEDGKKFNGYTNKLLFDFEKDEIWCATSKGLMLYDIRSNRSRFVTYPLLSEEVMGSLWINDMYRLRDSSIIFSTFAGLYRVTKEAGKITIKPFSILNRETFIGFRRLFQDEEGFVYVKSTGETLYILKPGKQKDDYELIRTIDFTPDIHHYFYDAQKKRILFATAGGLYSASTADFKVQKDAINDRLPFSAVSSSFRKNDLLWIFGEKGLYIFNEKNNTGTTFTVEDGLPANEFSLSVLAFGPGNRCIAGTSNGLVSFVPDDVPQTNLQPRAQLNGIYVNDVLHKSAPNANEMEDIHLSPRQNTFSFDFSAIAFQHIPDYSFEYKLGGYDADWIKSGNRRFTRYSKIPPGDYVFNLRVIDPQGRTSAFDKTLNIHIAPSFWQTLFFKLTIAALLLVIGWLFLKWYLNKKIRKQKLAFEKQQAIEKERTRIATDMHDDLGAGLSRIKFLSQALINKKTEDDSIKSGLERITGYSDEMTEKMGEIVWALNEKNDTLADLVAYTRAYAVEYLANHNIDCDANTPLHLPGTFIAGEIRRNIFLAVKECLHNVVKHSQASRVIFSVELNGNIQINIHDNGKGIDWDRLRPNGNGIQNIRQRMEALNGRADFSNDQGTNVVLQAPLHL